ncbi:MAG: hypothetical protein P1U82_30435 [Verrucomicrobiales bacterium]|nr:hypothetical protein [Verrucomicrobiales bacterium]
MRLTDTDGQPLTAWAHQRIKREVFDISGGWVAEKLGTINTLQAEPYLKTRRRLHVNAGMHQEVSGYSDSALFERYLLTYRTACNRSPITTPMPSCHAFMPSSPSMAAAHPLHHRTFGRHSHPMPPHACPLPSRIARSGSGVTMPDF